ncbi:rhodanese-like domain-containing protein [Lacinutrix sp. MedPE-SW]|uniref:rhodanese-like domain-containing protein n=1 Tax=Lacinutrix sp. MedPE-SW TaxID=1860087 RepID=UPI000924682F|nr:rhodanese-like domain-containing protein [Lacinutrix sp. MedPE-SW]OIQ18780.1 MAG: thioredoxin [Lacinutrix sp. MedPE-SW]
MKTKIIVLALFLGFTLLNCEDKKNNPVTVVSVEEMDTLLSLENVQLIDVRTKDEYDKGHINKSQNIDFNSPTFDTDIIGLDKEKPVILYCQRGGRSAKCAEKMQKAGFKKIYDLKGGFSKWQFKALDLKVKS